VYEVLEERTLTVDDSAAGVVRDVTLKRLGTAKHNSLLEKPLRIVEVRGSEPGQVWVLATNHLELSAELVAKAYHYRWQIELFFRWIKCVLGCRHLLSDSQNGVTLQVYCAMIAALLIGLWVGVKPDKRTYEMICHYLSGWATLEELERQIEKLRNKRAQPP
jgi:IS4 transposase